MDNKQIQQLAQLARIRIDDSAIGDVNRSISQILALVDQLQAVDTTGIEPMSHPMDATQRLRPDQITETDQRAALQTTAPRVENGLFVVPKVID
ncbi:MAG: Asp-tRNA(Asn)/Glu-tRNA(Gln) amidotransferase subunit GatC [Cellvibrionaceae bacterium]|nr:Asp-tRNA(Asn)/Glu-tRNA(Gln) amidotransferase subunit GatC [Cellvibrionaceae bacterium]